MQERLIGIDAGGTMTKVALFDGEGRELASEHRPNKMFFPQPGRTERDPDAMWQATCEAIRLVLTRTGTRPDDVAAVTPSGFGAGIFLVDGEGAVVRPGFVSTDARSRPVIEDWEEKGLAERAQSHIQAVVWPGQTLAILGWLSRHEPETLRRTSSVLACKDFLRLRLTGRIATDATDAGCAGLMDIRAGRYSDELLDLLGLGEWRSRLPEIESSTTVAGHVTAEAARLTGLKEGTPVVQGVYDVVGCSVASGLASTEQLGVVAGTFSINSTLHRQPLTDPLPTLQSPYPLDDLFIATIATPTSASNLEWFVKNILAAECDRQKESGLSIYDYCSRLVSERLDRSSALQFFPFLFGGPGGAPGALIGAAAGNDLGDVLRAVFEGIVLAHRADIDVLLGGAASARPRTIRLAGGPAKSGVWCQMFADGLGLPVEIADGTEFGAKGAAMCGAVAVGLHPDLPAAVAGMTRVERRYEPDPRRAEALDASYERFRYLGERLADVWKDLARLPARGAPRPARAVA